MKKSITFRPLRMLKTGQIAVATYTQWRRIKTADHHHFELIVSTEYRKFEPENLVYNYKGEPLFWKHYDPDKIPTLNRYALIDGEHVPYPEMWKTTDTEMYCAPGLDVDGVPCFSHGTKEELSKNPNIKFEEYIPLTVEIVTWWLGWFLYQLHNNDLNFK